MSGPIKTLWTDVSRNERQLKAWKFSMHNRKKSHIHNSKWKAIVKRIASRKQYNGKNKQKQKKKKHFITEHTQQRHVTCHVITFVNRTRRYKNTTILMKVSNPLLINHGGSVVNALDSWPRGREFDSRPVRYQVTTLGKLFTPTCLCRCTWSSGWCRLVLSGHGLILTAGHLQATLSKLLTYCVLRSTQPPTLSGTGNE